MTDIRSVQRYLETFAPSSLQESYDNSGLLVGDPDAEVRGVLVSLDCTEEVVQEAIDTGCNMVVAHHPVVFSGLRRLNGSTYVERAVLKAIKNDIALYAIHTNLDNVRQGVNQKIAERLGLQSCRVLAPKKGLLRKLVTFCPLTHAESVRQALFDAGAGKIGAYDECGFSTNGEGTFRAGAGANPFIGTVGQRHTEQEVRLEVVFESWHSASLIKALKAAHPYEEVAYDVYALENEHPEVGAGLLGLLGQEMAERDFLSLLKQAMGAECVRHTRFLGKKVQKIAVCGGSGSFLLSDAKKAGADVLVTADFKYHQFFDAENDLLIADIGHYESERFTMELIHDLILKKFPTFAVRLTGLNTNPVHYL
ncbi:MAG: Nif3-like dinuclear metal center hexameric protein [Bacteroidota bacterium]